MLQWFKKISQRYRPTGADPIAAETDIPESVSTVEAANPPLTDRDYEFLFTQLLEGISHGWQPVRIERFFDGLADRGSLEQWLEWLQRYGAKILASSAPNTTLARRMVALGEQTKTLPDLQKLGDTASGIGRLLLARERPGSDVDTWSYEEESTETASPPAAAGTTSPSSPATATDLVMPTGTGEGDTQTITLDELMVRLQEDENLVQQVSQRLGLETSDPHAIIQELVRQINQRQTEGRPAPPPPPASATAPSPSTEAPTAPTTSIAASEAERAFNDGVQKYEQGDFEGAIAAWEQAIALKADYYQAWGNRGLGLKNLKRYEAALESYDRALAIQPDFYKAWYNRGLVLDELRRHEEAIAAYDRVLAVKPDFHKAWYSRGMSLENLGQFAEATAAYDQALDLNPDFYKAWLSRGHCRKRLGNYEQALQDYEQALNLKADDPDIHRQRGEVLLSLGQYPDAIASYTQALALRSEDMESLGGRAQAQIQSGDLVAAVQDYEQVLQLNSDLSFIWAAKGRTLQQLGWEQAALDDFLMAQAREPDLPDAWQGQGNIFYQQQDLPEALQAYDRALTLQLDQFQVWHQRGQTLVALERWEEAIASFDRALQIAPDHWEIWRDRAAAAAASPQADLLLSALSAIAQRDARLNQRGLTGQLAILDYAIATVNPASPPDAIGQLYRVKGEALHAAAFAAPDGKPQPEYWHQALSAYQQAVAHLQPEQSPQAYLATLASKFLTELALEETPTAQKTYTEAQRVWNEQLSQPALPLPHKRKLALTMARLHQLRVDLALQMGELVQALEWAEWSRNFTLAWLWERLPLQEGSPKWNAIQRRLDDHSAIVYWHLSPVGLTTFIVTHELAEPLVLGRVPNVVLNVVLSPSLRARVESAKQNSAASLAILLELLGLDQEPAAPVSSLANPPKPPSSPEAEELAARDRLLAFHTWFRQWLDLCPVAGGAQTTEPTVFKTQLPEQLQTLRELLQIDAIVDTLQQRECNHVILVPHQGLQALPLLALFPDSFTATTLPSLRLAQPSSFETKTMRHFADPWFQGEAQPDVEDWLSLGLSTTTLGSETAAPVLCWQLPAEAALPAWEKALIEQCFGKTEPDPPPETAAALQQKLMADHRYVHWQTAVLTNPNAPQQSVLAMLPAEAPLQVAALSHTALDHLEVWTLRQPECFSVRYPAMQPDYVSVATALLSQGVTYILRPLWWVTEPAQSLFLVEFYRRLRQGSSSIVAHKQVQIWLRTIQAPELAQWYRDRAIELADSAAAEALEELARAIATDAADPSHKSPPYAHPYYWAGYTVMGYPL